jgi:hypothetical protein
MSGKHAAQDNVTHRDMLDAWVARDALRPGAARQSWLIAGGLAEGRAPRQRHTAQAQCLGAFSGRIPWCVRISRYDLWGCLYSPAIDHVVLGVAIRCCAYRQAMLSWTSLCPASGCCRSKPVLRRGRDIRRTSVATCRPTTAPPLRDATWGAALRCWIIERCRPLIGADART